MALLYLAGCSRSCFFFFFSSRRRHTRLQGDWSSDVCSSDLSSAMALPPADVLMIDEAHHCRALSYEKDRKSTRLNSSHLVISYAVFCLKKKKTFLTIHLHTTYTDLTTQLTLPTPKDIQLMRT